jgi:murein DD-endopeptidase MepM/ murein hydrolase activator NlpD
LSDYNKNLKILHELEEDGGKDGLFSTFGVTPWGEVLYFDETGLPWRAEVRGQVIVRTNPVNLERVPIEVVTTQDAFSRLLKKAQVDYQHAYMARLNRVDVVKGVKVKKKQERSTLFAAAGLLILTAFVILLMLNRWNVGGTLSQAERQLKEFYGSWGVDISGFKDVPIVPAPGNYNPLGGATISYETFRQFLVESNSPALPEAAAMYKACVEKGCDPAVALGFFEKESSLGKNGVASYTKSLGNIRCTSGYECFTTEGNGSFRRYATWADGMSDWVQLMHFYKNEWKLIAIEEIIPKYAPAADNNNPPMYIAGVKNRADVLRSREAQRTAATAPQTAPQVPAGPELPTGNPVREKDMVITQGFNDKHKAIDISRPAGLAFGTNIHTTVSGVVTVVRGDPLYGNRVLVRGENYTAHFNHLTDQIPVVNGQVVQRGQVVGLMGSTGNSTGPHLDYELFKGQERLNPMDWIFR